MATKPVRKSRKRIKNLSAKSLSTDKAKRVKGGPINWPNSAMKGSDKSSLLPAVQKVRES